MKKYLLSLSLVGCLVTNANALSLNLAPACAPILSAIGMAVRLTSPNPLERLGAAIQKEGVLKGEVTHRISTSPTEILPELKLGTQSSDPLDSIIGIARIRYRDQSLYLFWHNKIIGHSEVIQKLKDLGPERFESGEFRIDLGIYLMVEGGEASADAKETPVTGITLMQCPYVNNRERVAESDLLEVFQIFANSGLKLSPDSKLQIGFFGWAPRGALLTTYGEITSPLHR
jgi:hypothetical protein